MKQKINVGILGFGTVGAGVVKTIIDHQDLIKARLGADLIIKSIADMDIITSRGIDTEGITLTTDAFSVVEDPEIDIVVELIGGETIAEKLTLTAIENGKHIVTANKALIASKGKDMFNLANEKNVDFGFEASVGGCIPILRTIKESLTGNKIESVAGILNGTCNYILSSIEGEGSEFENALKEAQEKGFAEADPTLDIEGIDTAHKLAILTALAYGMQINLKDIHVEGITGITLEDINYAKEMGYSIKLLAISKAVDGVVDARVHPTMIPVSNLFSSVKGSINAVYINSEETGDMFLTGHGAGMMPTASAVTADIIDIARNILSKSVLRIPVMSFQPENIKNIPVLPIEEIVTRYYFRFSAVDRPGVLSKISGILGETGISIKSVTQKEGKTEGAVPIVMMTDRAKEANIRKAIKEIDSLDITLDSTIIIRVDENL